jgi:predicted peptidase
MRTNVLLGFWCVLIVAAVPGRATAINVSDFIDFSLRDAGGNLLLPGRLYVPPEASIPGAGPRPLLMNLPGSGGNGTDNLAQLPLVSDYMLSQAKQRGAFLYAPQTATNWNGAIITNQVMAMIDRAIERLNADTHRVYIVGYSLGSFGTWTMLSRYDSRFAAGVPISGGSPAVDFVPSRLTDAPIFAFQTRDDPAAPASATRTIINNILAADGQSLPTYPASGSTQDFMISNPNMPIHVAFNSQAHQLGNVSDFILSDPKIDFLYYERAIGGHNGALGAVNSPQVYDWMFSHSTAVPEPGGAGLLLAAVSLIALLSEPGRPRPRVPVV